MRALVLSGGGSKGSFQAGMVPLMTQDGRWYDLFCGISVGSINCAYLSQFRKHHEAMSGLIRLWRRVSTKKVYRAHKPFGFIHALGKTGLYSTSPLRRMIQSNLDVDKISESGKMLRIGAVDIQTGGYRVFDENYHDLVGAIMASSAFPFMFELEYMGGRLWIDGGVRNISPVKAAIDAGADEIDIIMTSPYRGLEKTEKPKNVIDVGTRTIDIMSNEIMVNDIKMAVLYNRLIDCGGGDGRRKIKMRLACPSRPLGDSLNFHPLLMAKRIEESRHNSRIMDL